MIVRPARPDDVSTLIDFRMRLVDSYGIGTQAHHHPDFSARIRERLVELLARDTYRFLVAEDDDGLAGCICGSLELSLPGPTWPGVVGVITDMWVEEHARGRGIARALVQDIRQWVAARGGEKIRLHSTPMAVPVYDRLGFHVAQPAPDDVFTTMWLDFPNH